MIAALYGEIQSDLKIIPSVLTNTHKLLHNAFEQAVLWEYVSRNPFRKENIPKAFLNEIPTLIQSSDNHMLTIAIHFAFAGSLRIGVCTCYSIKEQVVTLIKAREACEGYLDSKKL